MEAATHGGKAGEPRGALANPAQSSRSPPSTTAAVPGSAEINSLKEQNLVGGGAGPWEHPGATKEQASGSICSVLGPGWGLARDSIHHSLNPHCRPVLALPLRNVVRTQ